MSKPDDLRSDTDCPTCKATARVEGALKDTPFEHSMVALTRVMATKLAPDLHGTGQIGQMTAEYIIIQHLRQNLAYEFRQMQQRVQH